MSALPRAAAPDAAGLRPAAAARPVAALRSLFSLHEHQSEARVALEAFIAQRYVEAYGAQLRHFLPRLFGLHSATGELVAGFGLRPAHRQPLYLEHYLERPLEQVAARVTGAYIDRRELVEVGNLAGRHPGALRLLIPLLADRLSAEGYRWLAFTGSPRLINGFARLGIQLRPLAEARLEKLPPEERGDWGRYYEGGPAVMLGDIQAGRRHLDRNPQILQALGDTGSVLAGAPR